MRLGAGVFAALLLASTALGVASCREATQMQLIIKSNVPCDQLRGVAINVGASAKDLEDNIGSFAEAKTDRSQCGPDGTIGTVYLVPGAPQGAVLVRAGYGDQDPTACLPSNKYKGCIVARRTFYYFDARTLTITVNLDPNCLDVPCGVLSTCSNGSCVSSEAVCKGDKCDVDPMATRPADDPISSDAGSSDAGQSDATAVDAQVPKDASEDDAAKPGDDASADVGASDSGNEAGEPGPGDASPDVGSDGGADAGPDAYSDASAVPGAPCGFLDTGLGNRATSSKRCAVGEFCVGTLNNPAGAGACGANPMPSDLSVQCTRQSDCPPGLGCYRNTMAALGDRYTICMLGMEPLPAGTERVCEGIGSCQGKTCLPVPDGPAPSGMSYVFSTCR